MASSSSSFSARGTLRGLLRAIRTHVTSVAGNQQWRNHVLATARASMVSKSQQEGGDQDQRESSPVSEGHDRRPISGFSQGSEARQAGATRPGQVAADMEQLARDLTFLVNNVAHHKGLLASYNIGVNPDDRNKQMVEAVARRVGFQLPKQEPR